MERPIYQTIASRLLAMHNCQKAGNSKWFDRHKESISALVREHAPSGSGFDSGTVFDFDESTPEKLVFHTSFHHMTEGMYNGWSDHTVTVKPSLVFNFELKISGRDRDGVKDYIADMFQTFLSKQVLG